jgi:hypothetical protein
MLRLSGERKGMPLLNSPYEEGYPQISPDGKWLAYVSTETGRGELYVIPFPAGSGKWQVSTNGGNAGARWRRDGKELFYLQQGKLMSVAIETSGSTFKPSTPKELFEHGGTFPHPGQFNRFAVAADGQKFLLPRETASLNQDPTAASIAVVLNWSAGLKK